MEKKTARSRQKKAGIKKTGDIADHKRMQEGLEREAGQFKLILDVMGEGIYGVDSGRHNFRQSRCIKNYRLQSR